MKFNMGLNLEYWSNGVLEYCVRMVAVQYISTILHYSTTPSLQCKSSKQPAESVLNLNILYSNS